MTNAPETPGSCNHHKQDLTAVDQYNRLGTPALDILSYADAKMAEAISLAASIIGIASTGVSVVTALTKFSISYKESDAKIQELAARVSLTASILQAIGDTVKDNEVGFKKEGFMVTWKEVLDACSTTYNKLNTAISKAKAEDIGRGNSKKSSTWNRLK